MVYTYVMVYHNSSGRCYREPKEKTERPVKTHADDQRVTCGMEEDQVIKEQNALKQLAAKCCSIVKHQEIISVTN